ncbi:hypothetical protein EKK58_09625 [Candidatus Dependentiae bacterium]|nr:MAG: hypothetical protein EKK58_09625 [Candidatus Dependentiae bacterium]
MTVKIKKEEHQREILYRRIRVLMVDPVAFTQLFTKGLLFAKRTKLIEGVPEDAKLRGVVYDIRLEAIMMMVESSEYEPVPSTELPPRQLVEIRAGVPGATKKKKKK